MIKFILLTFIGGLFLMGCSNTSTESTNPFYTDYSTPYAAPPFDKIEITHYRPAFEDGINIEKNEIEAIAADPEPATFTNTIEALEKKGELLEKVKRVFYNLQSSNTNDEMQAIAKELSPKLSALHDDMLLNEKLFQRIKILHENMDKLDLNTEQKKLLDDYYKDFTRNGANLDKTQKEELRKINEELGLLSLQFDENILKENNRFEMVVNDQADLAGLPEAVISAAAESAKELGYEGKWVFTLHKPSLIPFLQYSEKRDLREKMFKGYISRGNNNDDLDNKEILLKTVVLRLRRAQLLGYETHADYVLEINMAKKAENVYDLLMKVWDPALQKAKQEVRELQALIDAEGADFKLKPWDWWYYTEKLKNQKYGLDEEMLRPYFQVDNVRQGAFDVASKLYGITFSKRLDIPVYHEDVTVYEVKNADGSLVGILYTDYFPRKSKSGGAWMNEFRAQSNMDGKEIRPLIVNVGNFSKPTSNKPALISYDEALTLFHEFGHALHGLLSKCTYPSLSGTNVPRDFVELPSQIMENWASEPEVLRSYAHHYQTGAPIPEELIEKIKKTAQFNQGFINVEKLAAAILDMDWHTLKTLNEKDPNHFDKTSMARIHLIDEIVPRYYSPYFAHIFAGSYSAGYYSYIWAEVLDADAFQAFKEHGIFDQKTAKSFRENILERGGSEDPMVLYRRFRGAEPRAEALLQRAGLN
jgi:peptidyl-dipeptidase Dcp